MFTSDAGDLVPGDNNGVSDVFVKDLATGALVRVSTSAAGAEGDGPSLGTGALVLASVEVGGGLANGASYGERLTADGRQVVFQSDAANLVTADGDRLIDVFSRDLVAGATTRAGSPEPPAMLSADGRFLVFSTAAALVVDDTNGVVDVYVRRAVW